MHVYLNVSVDSDSDIHSLSLSLSLLLNLCEPSHFLDSHDYGLDRHTVNSLIFVSPLLCEFRKAP